jgi:tetratricopeptide (TPR) repeat protein
MRRAALLLVLAAARLEAAPALPAGLEGAQQLYRQNRWAQAREHLKGSGPTFLVGRSWVREAELYDAVHRFTVDAGSEYLTELKAMPGNKTLVWIPLFTGLYHLEAGRHAEAERALAAALKSPGLPADWRPIAKARLAQAAARQTPSEMVKGATLESLEVDKPTIEAEPEKGKTLRFFDPVGTRTRARLSWERAATELQPIAEKGTGPEATLAAFYRGLSLHAVGQAEPAAAQMKAASDPTVLNALAPVQKVVVARATWTKAAPPDYTALWNETRGHREGVFFWADLVRSGEAAPVATHVTAALRDAVTDLEPRGNGALYGQWGFARLALGAEPREVLEVLEAARDKSNKNKLESNDPLLLLAICKARAAIQDYPQALETLFEMGKTLPGLRPLQWNLQGLYAARQKAGGEARISQ